MEAITKQITHQLKQKQEQIQALHRQLEVLYKEEKELLESLQLLKSTHVPSPTASYTPLSAQSTPYTPLSAQTTPSPSKTTPSREEVQPQVSNKKQKWYVIFDGPFKGIYSDWGIANSHITGKSVTHKSYTTKDAAETAFKEAYKTVLKEETQRSSHMTPLRNHPLSKLNPMNKMNNIMSTKEKEEQKKPTIEKFQKLWDSLINYNEVHTTMMFYPKNRRPGPKAIFLPGAEPLTVWDYFNHGLIDTIYINGVSLEEVREFPPKVQLVIKNYKERFAKGRELFIKMYASYPIFDEQQNILVPTITFAQMGVSNEKYPTRDELEKETPQLHHLVTALAGVYLGSSRIGNGKEQKDRIRVNYCSKNMLIYSNNHEELNQAGIDAIYNFEEQFEEFTGQLSELPQEFKKELCQHIAVAPRHRCENCKDKDKEDMPIME